MGYRTCYYRCFSIGYASHAMIDAYKQCRTTWMRRLNWCGRGERRRRSRSVWPKAQEFGFPDEEAAFALQFGHGIGWRSGKSRVIHGWFRWSTRTKQAGMVFALETFWPSKDGWSGGAHRGRDCVTATGHEVITRFRQKNWNGGGSALFTVDGPLSTTRENEGLPQHVKEMVAARARRSGGLGLIQ